MSTLRVDNIKSRTGSVLTVPETNTLAVTGIVSVTSSGSLQVAGNETIGGNQTVSGNQTITGNQLISGISTNTGVARFTGDVSIGGTLTYEDVTNVDSVGLITARNGINMSGGTATFAGAIDANGALDVDGQTDLDVLNVSDTATFSGTIDANGDVNLGNASSDTITIAGHVDSDIVPSGTTRDLGSSSAEWRNLFINGTAKVDTLTVDENAGVTGNLTVTGNTILNGNVDIGDATGDTITANGRFDSDLVPSSDNARDLGASGLEWKDLFLDGTANIDSLVADTANVSALTNGRVVYAGSSGVLQDSSNLTFNGSTLTANAFAGNGAALTNVNATTLDSIDSTHFVRSNNSDDLTGATYNFSGSTGEKIKLSGTSDPFIRWQENTTDKAYIEWTSSLASLRIKNTADSSTLLIRDDLSFSTDGSTYYSVIHANNVGSGQALSNKDVHAAKFVGRLENLTTSNKTSSYTTVKADAGTMIRTNSGVTIGNSIYAAGDIISIYNNSGSDITIYQSSTTLRKVGTSDTGNITLALRGLMTVTCVSSNEFVCSGGGMS